MFIYISQPVREASVDVNGLGSCKDLKGLEKLKNIKDGRLIFFALVQERHLRCHAMSS